LPVTYPYQVRRAFIPFKLDSFSNFYYSQVVKSRIQGAEKVPGVIPKYNWTYPALVTIAREEGFVALYKGFVPKVLRLAPGGGILLLVVEFTLGMFRTGMRSLLVATGSNGIAFDSAWTSICLNLFIVRQSTCKFHEILFTRMIKMVCIHTACPLPSFL
jgi:hypothetical protein